ncbi:MAG: type IV pilin, partial [Aeromonadaceae bacterium]|nr:type IV pilin [Aeromonadaceae bacterium]
MMITLVMVAILATVGYPSFSHYLRQSRRVQAQTDLLTLQLRLEEYRLNHSGESPTLAALSADLSVHYDYQLQVT